jgi:hypothetical protein
MIRKRPSEYGIEGRRETAKIQILLKTIHLMLKEPNFFKIIFPKRWPFLRKPKKKFLRIFPSEEVKEFGEF